jgi:hypothetical protein
MSVTVNLELPDNVATQAKRLAKASKRPLESELVALLTGLLGNDEGTGLSPEQANSLAQLKVLDDEQLTRAACQRVAAAKTERIQLLLDKQTTAVLSPAEHDEMLWLRDHANLVMLVRAEAASILQARGHDVTSLLDD